MEKEISEIAKLTERIAKDPKSKLFVPLAEEYKKAGDIEMAIHVLSEGLKNNPGYITARSSLGRLLLERGDLGGAQKELEEVIKAIPDNLLAQRKLGDIYVLQGRSSDALQRFRTCFTLNPGDKELAALITALEAGQDIAARIPKPKALSSLGSVKQPDVHAPTSAVKVPPTVVTETTVPAPPKAPAPDVREAATVPAPPASQKQPAEAPPAVAPPAVPVPDRSPAEPAAPAPKPETRDDIEVVEEIVELEPVESLPAETAPGTVESAEPSEAVAELRPEEVLAPAEEQFDLSEPVAEAVPVPEGQPPVAWDAAPQPILSDEAAPVAEESSDGINTNTLAELYIAQGFYEKAIEIYEGMLGEDQGNAVLQQKVSSIRSMAGIAERNASFLRQETPIEQIQPTEDPFASSIRREPTPAPEEELPLPVPPSAEPQEPAEVADVVAAASDATALPEELPQAASQQSDQELGAPATALPVGQGLETSEMLAAQDAETRRQATIDRLESWLKNVIKEKP